MTTYAESIAEMKQQTCLHDLDMDTGPCCVCLMSSETKCGTICESQSFQNGIIESIDAPEEYSLLMDAASDFLTSILPFSYDDEIELERNDREMKWGREDEFPIKLLACYGGVTNNSYKEQEYNNFNKKVERNSAVPWNVNIKAINTKENEVMNELFSNVTVPNEVTTLEDSDSIGSSISDVSSVFSNLTKEPESIDDVFDMRLPSSVFNQFTFDLSELHGSMQCKNEQTYSLQPLDLLKMVEKSDTCSGTPTIHSQSPFEKGSILSNPNNSNFRRTDVLQSPMKRQRISEF